jgi:hypothetical protein
VTKIVAHVPSMTTPGGEMYEIAHDERAGVLSCSCPAFSFGPRQDKTCKHIETYRAAELLMDKCSAAHGTPGERVLCKACLIGLLAASARKIKTKAKTVRRDPSVRRRSVRRERNGPA